jgi:hypothetical protein
MGFEPAGKGEAVTCVKTPLLESIEYADTSFEALLATKRNCPFESIAREEGLEPVVVREDASVRAPLVESIVKREMSPPSLLATYRNFFEG